MTIVPSDGGRITPDLFVTMRELTQRIIAERGAFWTNQFESLGDEVWAQTEGTGTGRLVPMWDPSLANAIEPVVTLACDHGLKYISTDLYR
ncbi:MAG: hypothetical protein NUW22_01825 [Acidobacteria bacterium]|nr:hypothetical protein [Acidobacteriota bacterium]